MQDTVWTQRKASEIRIGEILIRNVEPAWEWVPGPYGAFIVQEVVARGDEWTLSGIDASGVDKSVHQFSFDVDELVWIKPLLH